MAFAIKIRPDNESAVMAVLQHIADFDSRKEDMFVEIGGYGVYSTQDRFIGQHDVDGNPWKQSWRAQMQNGQTGRDTGELMNELHYNLRPDGVEWGSNKMYAHVFHFGATILPKTAEYLTFAVGGQFRKVKQVNIPSRTFLGINQDDDEEILNIIGRHIGV